ncbi:MULTISPECIES: aminotransferase-like domain-containing protein [unclassified Bradyrhizobium]
MDVNEHANVEIDLRRVTSPLVAGSDQLPRQALEALLAEWLPADELRQHRKLGTWRDRCAAAAFLGQRYSLPLDPARVFLASGTQNILFVLLAALAGRDSTVLAEEMTYRQIREASELMGFQMLGVPLDDDGISPDALDELCQRHAPKVLYCIPTAQNPTASIMPLERRLAVAEVARRHGVTIIEDEAQGLIPYHAPPPLSDVAPDITWTITGLSKCAFVGLRIAYVVAPDAHRLAEVMEPFNATALWYASTLSAAVATRFVEGGQAEKLLDEIRTDAAQRQSMAAQMLPYHLSRIGNGLHVWILDPARTGDQMRQAAQDHGVLVRSASEYQLAPTADSPGIRISLADVSSGQLREALGRLQRALAP